MQLDDYNPMQHIYLLTAQCGKELVKSFQQNFLAHNSMKWAWIWFNKPDVIMLTQIKTISKY